MLIARLNRGKQPNCYKSSTAIGKAFEHTFCSTSWQKAHSIVCVSLRHCAAGALGFNKFPVCIAVRLQISFSFFMFFYKTRCAYCVPIGIKQNKRPEQILTKAQFYFLSSLCSYRAIGGMANFGVSTDGGTGRELLYSQKTNITDALLTFYISLKASLKSIVCLILYCNRCMRSFHLSTSGDLRIHRTAV